jgi:hypothetical protein
MFVIAMHVTVSSVQINHEHRNSTALQLNSKVQSCCCLLLIPQLLLLLYATAQYKERASLALLTFTSRSHSWIMTASGLTRTPPCLARPTAETDDTQYLNVRVTVLPDSPAG